MLLKQVNFLIWNNRIEVSSKLLSSTAVAAESFDESYSVESGESIDSESAADRKEMPDKYQEIQNEFLEIQAKLKNPSQEELPSKY